MSLIRCKECGNQVSDAAPACPRCGTKPDKSMGALKRIFLGFFALVFVASAGRLIGRDASVVAIPAAEPQRVDPKQEALGAIKFDFSWYKSGYGNVMMMNAKLENSGKRSVKDIEITCVHSANSGTKIDSNTKVLFEQIQPGEKKTVKNFNMGFIHTQASKSNCHISDLKLI